jgi:peroxiredoxin
LLFVNADTLQIKSYIEIFKEPKEVYKISPFVYTGKDGNITIALSDYNRKKYFVAFYETDNTPVLEIKDIRDPMLIIDKTNFGHSGWFRFELYEDGKLKEKNKLLIPQE